MTPLKSQEQLKAEGWNENQALAQLFALADGVDISYLDSSKWTWEQMAQQRKALVNEVCLADVAPDCDWAAHTPRRADGRAFVDTDPTVWEADKMLYQVQGLQIGLDFSGIDPKGLRAGQMQEYCCAFKDGLDITNLDRKKWNWVQMNEQRLALCAGHDLSHVDPGVTTWLGMQEVRYALRRESATGATTTKGSSR